MKQNYCCGCMRELSDNENVCAACGYAVNTRPKEPYHMEPGTIIQGRYLIGKVIGYGGFGVTYVGMDLILEKKIAVKEYLPSDFSTRMPGQTMLTVYTDESEEQFTAGLTSFINEAKRLAKFNDVPGVVKILDSFVANNTAYIIMEFLEGETAKTRLEKTGKFSYEEASKLLVAVLDTLDAVHEANIIHRDISPDNIFLTNSGEIKLLDFGAARYAATTHSKSLSVILKPGYAPEEQYRSHGNQGPWSDVYASAATLYKLITGITPEESLERLANDVLKEPSRLGVKISKDAENALMNALNIKAEDRTQSAAAFKDALLSTSPVLRNYIKQKKQDTRKWPIWLRVGIAATAVVLVLAPILIFTGVLNPDLAGWATKLPEGMLNAPGVINKTLEAAEKIILDKKLIVKIVDKQNSEKSAANTVMQQSPLPGRLLAYGDVLEITISAGVEQIYMPNVVNFSKEDAVELLQQLGLKVKLEEKNDPEFALGTVLQQSIAENTPTPRNTTITLTIAVGGAEITDEEVEMPKLDGMAFDAAAKQLRQLGLYASIKEEVFAQNVPKNTVMAQGVKAGEKVKKGSNVFLTVSKGSEKVRMPDVQYKNESEALSMLDLNGIKASLSYKENDTVAKGVVISQSIAAGTELQPGCTVELVVSLGNDLTVPSTVGKDKASAESMLSGAGLKAYVIEQFSETADKGAVITQAPASGEKVAKGSTITITISKGKDPKAKKVIVPSLISTGKNEAIAALRGMELTAVISEAFSDSVGAGIVISQSPAAGQEAVRGGSVSIVLSKGSDKNTVPTLGGMSEGTAVSSLQGAGFVATVSKEFSDIVANGIVISQSMSGRQLLGTTINVVVSKGSDKNTVPTLGGMSEGAAVSSLQGAGFSATVAKEHSSSVARGNVISQSMSGRQLLGSTVTIVVSRGIADSGWIDGNGSNIDASSYTVTTQTLYQFRDKLFQDSAESVLSGWEAGAPRTEAWSGWSAWQDSEIGGTETREVTTQVIQVQTGSKQQWFYTKWEIGNGRVASYDYGGSTKRETGWEDTRYSPDGNSSDSSKAQKYKSPTNYTWYNEQTRTEPIYGNKTQWCSRDKVYTYHYWQWGAWGEFSQTAIGATDTREVITKQQYRYSGK